MLSNSLFYLTCVWCLIILRTVEYQWLASSPSLKELCTVKHRYMEHYQDILVTEHQVQWSRRYAPMRCGHFHF